MRTLSQSRTPIAVLALAAALSACGGKPPAKHTDGESEPCEDQGGVLLAPEVCVEQSPINILTDRVEHDREHRVRLHYEPTPEEIVNLGHTVQVEFAPGSTVEFDGQIYGFRQFHFHTPAEHQIDGVTYPMEMHMVHTHATDEREYLVIALLFKHGPPSEFLADFIEAIPAVEGERVVEPAGFVDITSVLDSDEHYFHYHGSLTTAPYTESVTWLIAETPRTASEAQVGVFRGIEGQNARAVQARHGRVVDEL
jgi:carbonic anhydrase